MNPFTNRSLTKATADMTPAEAGVYLKLILHAREQGRWPQTKAEISRITGCSNSHIDRYRKPITKAAEIALLWVPVEWVPVEWVTLEKREKLLQFYKVASEKTQNEGSKSKKPLLSSSYINNNKNDDKNNHQNSASEIKLLGPADLLRQRPSQLEVYAMSFGMPPEVIDQEIAKWDAHHKGNAIKDSQHALNLWRYWCKSYTTKQHEKIAERRGAEPGGKITHKAAQPVTPEAAR